MPCTRPSFDAESRTEIAEKKTNANMGLSCGFVAYQILLDSHQSGSVIASRYAVLLLIYIRDKTYIPYPLVNTVLCVINFQVSKLFRVFLVCAHDTCYQ